MQQKGLTQLLAVLNGLPKDVASTIILDGVKEGAKPLQKVMRRRVRKATGGLSKVVAAKAKKSRHKGTAVAFVGAAANIKVRDGKRLRRGDNDPNADKPARHGHLLEFGHMNRDGTRTPAYPWVRPSANEAAPAVTAATAVGIQKGLIKSIKRLRGGLL